MSSILSSGPRGVTVLGAQGPATEVHAPGLGIDATGVNSVDCMTPTASPSPAPALPTHLTAAVMTAPATVEMRDVALPEIGPQQVLVALEKCGLCTMERRLFRGERQIYPVAAGHEAAGTIVAHGDKVASLQGVPAIGQRVAIDMLSRNRASRTSRRARTALDLAPQEATLTDGTIAMGGGLATYMVADAASVWSTGDAPAQIAAMTEPLACVSNSVRLSGIRPGDRVAITGAGFMGRLHLILARLAGASSIGVIDVDRERLQEARDAGASWVATPDELAAYAHDQDVVFVTAGVPGALEQALGLVAIAGSVVLFGAFPKDLSAGVSPDEIHHHGLSIIGVYSQEPEDWQRASALIGAGVVTAELQALVTADYPLAEAYEALDFAAHNPVMRVLVGG